MGTDKCERQSTHKLDSLRRYIYQNKETLLLSAGNERLGKAWKRREKRRKKYK